jgi:hypothetical protein
MPMRKSLLEIAEECERRARNVTSEGDREQLKQIAKESKESAARSNIAIPTADPVGFAFPEDEPGSRRLRAHSGAVDDNPKALIMRTGPRRLS